MIRTGLMALALLGATTLAIPAQALQDLQGTSGADTIYIGCVTISGSTEVRWCHNGTVTVVEAAWSGCTMGDDIVVEGLGGGDYISIIKDNGTSLDCGDGTVRTWNAPTFNGHYLDLEGDAGEDRLYGSRSDTRVIGGTEDDFVKNYTNVSSAGCYGNEDDDDVISAYNGGGDNLYGHDGDDCVDDRTDTWANFSCSSGTNDYGTSLPFGGGCEHLTTCCEALSCGTEGPAGGGGDEPSTGGGGDDDGYR